jgi:hypothetical protein
MRPAHSDFSVSCRTFVPALRRHQGRATGRRTQRAHHGPLGGPRGISARPDIAVSGFRYGIQNRVETADRTNAGRVHMEDFAQLCGVQPQFKYMAAGNHNIADALNRAVSLDAAIEFVRRLALAAATGNGDTHLKNWSVVYRGDGRTPQLAPVYDVLSTIAYLPNDSFALSLGGEKSFKGLTQDRWRNFANRARLPEGAVIKAVAETAAAIRDLWPKLSECDVVPKSILDVIDKHVAAVTPILDPIAVSTSMR